ncbi:unnamed protein product [Taenia asiatica]|uniref:Integrase catalytic domain-containing protein n=1 Tax=Taenia asiatica TaxID=60517 RepID=A0A0R3W0C6_TAEAS|nr:unnamed protein product [Taenia asiatica]
MRTTPGNPQGNGQVEGMHRTLVGLLKTFTKEAKPEDWNLSLGHVLLAYRATAHTSTVKVLSPTNYLVQNAELRTQSITVHHSKMRRYKGVPPVGYEDEVCGIMEERKLPDGIAKANGRE